MKFYKKINNWLLSYFDLKIALLFFYKAVWLILNFKFVSQKI